MLCVWFLLTNEWHKNETAGHQNECVYVSLQISNINLEQKHEFVWHNEIDVQPNYRLIQWHLLEALCYVYSKIFGFEWIRQRFINVQIAIRRFSFWPAKQGNVMKTGDSLSLYWKLIFIFQISFSLFRTLRHSIWITNEGSTNSQMTQSIRR